jgi:heavy metal sensor kinase
MDSPPSLKEKSGLPGRSLWRSLVSVRLTAWYFGLFSLSLAVLFGFVYWTLDGTLRKSNSELLHSKVKEFADTYIDSGLTEIAKDSSQKRSDEFLIRLSNSQNKTLFASLPYSDPQGPAALKALETRPITPTERGFQLQIGRNALRKRVLLQHFVASCAAVTFPVLLLALAGGALMANRALRPLRVLTATVQNIVATGKLDARIPPENTAGELRDLVISFDQMLGKIESLVQGMRGVLDNVAHDLRTPITRLRGVAEMALSKPGDLAGSQEALADCVEESERVITMLNTLMDISEVETGAMKLNLRPVNVAGLARQLTEFYAEVAQEKGIEISLAADGPCEAVADENRLRQALGNLLDNAVKYTPAGGSVKVAVEQTASQVVVSVRDTGIGIPPEDLSRVWERLFRGDKSRSQRGLGLGLSLVRAIAQAHSGDCQVQSEPGAGSEFTLRIPIRAC